MFLTLILIGSPLLMLNDVTVCHKSGRSFSAAPAASTVLLPLCLAVTRAPLQAEQRYYIIFNVFV